MAGVKGRSGRKRNIQNVVKYFNEQFDLSSYDLVLKLLELAKSGDKDMLVYAFNRRLGNPKSISDLRVKGEFITADDYLLSQRLAESDDRKFLEEVTTEGEDDAV